MIRYKDVMKKLEDHLKDITLEQLNKELEEAGMNFYAIEKQPDSSPSVLNDRVIKRVICKEATKDCEECVCSKPHERHFITEEDNKPCTTWNYCHYKNMKVRCTKVL